MDSVMLFGPLSKDYCLWFYLLSVAGFVLFILVIVGGIVIGVSKKRDFSFYLQMLIGSLVYAMIYFQNRLLYSMCTK